MLTCPAIRPSPLRLRFPAGRLRAARRAACRPARHGGRRPAHRRALPLVVAPLIAGVVLSTLHSYPALFTLSALATLTGGGSVRRIRAVR